jgi:hypothetical protein
MPKSFYKIILSAYQNEKTLGFDNRVGNRANIHFGLCRKDYHLLDRARVHPIV